MSKSLWADVAKDGLWKNNPALVQILGLCPTMAVTTTATNALGLGIATTLVMALSNLVVPASEAGSPMRYGSPFM